MDNKTITKDKLKYDYKDFRPVGEGLICPEEAAIIAQRIHDKWLKEQAIIYAVGSTSRIETLESLLWSQETTIGDDFKAHLVAIERVEYED